jgi:UDP-N-acetyl-D-glucosamine dehydrogenase
MAGIKSGTEKTMYKQLREKILNKKARIGIIGMGYVGLSLAIGFSKKGFKVYGIDIDKDRIGRLKKGQSYVVDIPASDIIQCKKEKTFIPTADLSCIRSLDAVIVCVPTPVNKAKEPDVSFIASAVKSIARYIKRGHLVVLESTTYPGTTEEIMLPALEAPGWKEGKDFYLAFSPERIDPGNKTYKVGNTPKIVGGISGISTEMAVLLYRQVIDKVYPASSSRVAEMVKLLENTFRIVNVSLVNEIMIMCDRLDVDVWEVIELARTKPYGFMPFYPGPGIGGHCIPVDPLYLSWKARAAGFEARFIELASYVNTEMPRYVISKVVDALNEMDKPLKRAKVLVLGVTYKKDVKDLRESPALEIMDLLVEKGAHLSYHDPFMPFLRIFDFDLKGVPLNSSVLKDADCVIVIADHTDVDYKLVAKHSKLVIDTRNALKDIPKRSNIVKI